jgi:hypothetical protein
MWTAPSGVQVRPRRRRPPSSPGPKRLGLRRPDHR